MGRITRPTKNDSVPVKMNYFESKHVCKWFSSVAFVILK